MMGQELFEKPLRQYPLYNITALKEESAGLGHPDDFDDGNASPEQLALIESVLETYPDKALTYDEDSSLWIVGADDDLNRMFADRDEFLDALEAGEDPGV